MRRLFAGVLRPTVEGEEAAHFKASRLPMNRRSHPLFTQSDARPSHRRRPIINSTAIASRKLTATIMTEITAGIGSLSFSHYCLCTRDDVRGVRSTDKKSPDSYRGRIFGAAVRRLSMDGHDTQVDGIDLNSVVCECTLNRDETLLHILQDLTRIPF